MHEVMSVKLDFVGAIIKRRHFCDCYKGNESTYRTFKKSRRGVWTEDVDWLRVSDDVT